MVLSLRAFWVSILFLLSSISLLKWAISPLFASRFEAAAFRVFFRASSSSVYSWMPFPAAP